MEVLARNCEEFGIRLYAMGEPGQGIVHVIGPEQGLTQPGMTIVCGDSHTSTHGAFGALAVGIGTSEVEHVLATQTLPQARARRRWRSPSTATLPDGRHREGRRARDHRPPRHRGRHRLGHRVPRVRHPRAVDGRADDGLQHVDRGGRARRDGRARRHDVRLPRGPRVRAEGRGVGAGARRLAVARHRRRRDVRPARSCSTPPRIRPTVTWGTNPAQSVDIDDVVPAPTRSTDADSRDAARARARVHGPARRAPRSATSPSTPCSSARAPTRASKTCAPRPRSSRDRTRAATGMRALVVPGSMAVKAEAEAEGLTRCSSPPDSSGAKPGARCASR